jgi:2,4-dichlorophenol 6-monooxygenase
MYIGWRAREAMAQASDVLLEVFGKLLGRAEGGATASVAAE